MGSTRSKDYRIEDENDALYISIDIDFLPPKI